ncbi:ELKS/Rab6-interacting/CAST family member 1-like isoform X2 [Chelmon rostratus]|uniref:ELKS/Rab6-interacting/CAST family member 1-like isoform X2 n=1 Tax=Chelmon rostratus TaxID=109905 RepID=UPI001BE9DFC3|nr:ELKS/Rab6-interacting/CAST family member 1-like isoform X2 [Chelmon rostratus]
MVTKVAFLLAFFGVAASKLPHRRKCDPEPRQETPTLCSNYKNILHLDDIQTKLGERQMMLEQRIDALERKTGLHLESANSNISALEISVSNLSSALQDLERMKAQTEAEIKDAKTQLQKHKLDIAGLKREVRDLVEHRERVGGNFSEIEKKLDTTERQLREKKAKLENLETETEAAFSDTQRLLDLYKNELSHLNVTTRELEVKVEARLGAARAELEAKLKKIQNNTFSTKLNEQKAEVDEFKEEIDRKFCAFDKKLKTQQTAVEQREADIDTLKSISAGIKNRLESTEIQLAEQNKLKLAVNRLATEVNAKVAFSATIVESPGVFTGPATTNNILIFDRALTNTGNAYDCSTGIFTAPLKGVYHFSFMTFGYNRHTSGAILVKNGHYQVSTWEFTGLDKSDTTSNTVILELNVSDTVNIILWKGGKVHTSVFSGFLVFPTS